MLATDSRDNIGHDIEIGQVYEDKRTNEHLLLVYYDSSIHIVRDKQGNHRLGKRREFTKNVGSGRYTLAPDVEPFGETGLLQRVLARADEYDNMDGYKADHKAAALREAVNILTDDNPDVNDESVPFEDLDNIGDKAAKNLRDAGFRTVGDCRRASDNDLGDVAWVGDKGVESIREYCQ